LSLAPKTRSAIVFFTIFSDMFLKELGEPGLGTSYDVAQGFAVFFRMSLGAVASGILFGWGTRVLLYLLKLRLSREECVVEVATTFTMAYLSYFVNGSSLSLFGSNRNANLRGLNQPFCFHKRPETHGGLLGLG
jgi:hypothetical protein